MSEAGKLRALLRGDGMIVAPGAYDGITARLIEQAGFGAVYMTGAGTSATLGYPDFGLLTMTRDGRQCRAHRPRRRTCR